MGARECLIEFALQSASNSGGKLAIKLITELVDLVGPVEPLVRRRRMLDKQQVLDDPLRQAENGLVLAFAQVLDLLGQMREVERHVRPRPGETAQLLRLRLRPGVEVGFVQLLRLWRAHGRSLGHSGPARQRGSPHDLDRNAQNELCPGAVGGDRREIAQLREPETSTVPERQAPGRRRPWRQSPPRGRSPTQAMPSASIRSRAWSTARPSWTRRPKTSARFTVDMHERGTS
jgi:hypothetical protein